MDKEILEAINAVSKRVNSLEKKLSLILERMKDNSDAKIDYIAMMSDIDLDEGKEEHSHE